MGVDTHKSIHRQWLTLSICSLHHVMHEVSETFNINKQSSIRLIMHIRVISFPSVPEGRNVLLSRSGRQKKLCKYVGIFHFVKCIDSALKPNIHIYLYNVQILYKHCLTKSLCVWTYQSRFPAWLFLVALDLMREASANRKRALVSTRIG